MHGVVLSSVLFIYAPRVYSQLVGKKIGPISIPQRLACEPARRLHSVKVYMDRRIRSKMFHLELLES